MILVLILAVFSTLIHAADKEQAAPLQFPNTIFIPIYAFPNCQASNGVLYIDTVQIFSQPTPFNMPSCAFGYTFYSYPNIDLYFTMLNVGQRCMGPGSTMWVNFAATGFAWDFLGYQLVPAQFYPGFVKNAPVTSSKPVEKAMNAFDTIYTPIYPYVCLNTFVSFFYPSQKAIQPIPTHIQSRIRTSITSTVFTTYTDTTATSGL